jgi:hypothetical protein
LIGALALPFINKRKEGVDGNEDTMISEQILRNRHPAQPGRK